MKFFIATYGCQMNKYDSHIIESVMQSAGHERIKSIEQADIVFVNGCSVREHAQTRAMGFVSTIKSKIQRDADVYITGCISRSIEQYPAYIKGLISPVHYDKLPDIINRGGFIDMRDLEADGDYAHVQVGNRLTMFVSVIKGCNNFCSYCIVPYLRGMEVSFAPETILKQIEMSINDMTGEIVLLGQNVNSYHYNDADFPVLLSMIARQFQDKRIRFLTSHPKDLSDRLIETMSQYDNIMNALHLPFQSGSDRILQSMHRGYTRTHYLNIIDKLRKAMPDIALTTDVMVGFPGEEEADFEHTMEIIKSVRFDDAFMYKYSRRRFTLASFMAEPPEDIKLQRLKHLIKTQNSIKMDKMKDLLGRDVQILVERQSKQSPMHVIGRDQGDRMIVLRSNHQPGDIVSARIIDIAGNTPIAEKKEAECI